MHGRWNEDPFQVAKTRKHRGERMVAVLREEVGAAMAGSRSSCRGCAAAY